MEKHLTQYQDLFRKDQFATHQPVLFTVVTQTEGPIIECGCGFGSTPLLHALCAQQKRPLLTLESDHEWFQKFIGYETPWHEFIEVDYWNAVLEETIKSTSWALAFIDQAPWEARFQTIQLLKDKAGYIILHDCDYFPVNGIFGVNHEPIKGPDDTGKRTYDDIFKYSKEFFPLKPWPYKPTGPPTLLASNFHPCDFDVDYAEFQKQNIFLRTLKSFLRNFIFRIE